VKAWHEKTPYFSSTAKVLQVVTPEKVLVGCDEELAEFLRAMDVLREKLDPLLLQFGYFKSFLFKSGSELLSRLKPFLKKPPKGYKFVVEIRNRVWLEARLLSMLHRGQVVGLLRVMGKQPPFVDLISYPTIY
jgi:uncharacterized protein YecE (DUF72 family)